LEKHCSQLSNTRTEVMACRSGVLFFRNPYQKVIITAPDFQTSRKSPEEAHD
jgi:hypothetical protein